MTDHEGLSRRVRHGDVDLHVLDTGDRGDGRPPVLFVPGLTDVALDYVEVLADFGRRTVVVDLRGRGGSSSPAAGYATEDHVGDIAAVVEATGLDAFHLATFSRGTAYGLSYAFEHPEQVLSVTVGDYEAVEIGIPGGRWPDAFVGGHWRGRPVLERISEVALTSIAVQSRQQDFFDRLAGLDRPLQVVRGGMPNASGFVFVDDEAVARFREAVPDVVVHTFAESRHDLFRPDRRRYPRVVAAFAAAHDPVVAP